jgi:hypothetical protein
MAQNTDPIKVDTNIGMVSGKSSQSDSNDLHGPNVEKMEKMKKCGFNPDDFKLLANIKINNDLNSNIQTQNSDDINNYIRDLTQFITTYNYTNYKCAINDNEVLLNKYNDLCTNSDKKKQTELIINYIEKIVNDNDKNLDKVVEKIMIILQSFEKDCFKRDDPILANKIKKIFEKLGRVFYKCEDIIEKNQANLNEYKKIITEKHKDELDKCEKNLSDKNNQDKSKTFFEKNYLWGWILMVVLLVIAILILIFK